MKQINLTIFAVSILFAAVIIGCGGATPINKEPSSSAIRAAEESGASKVPNASLYLQLAKEELEHAKVLAAQGEKEQAVERVRMLRQDNQLPQGKK